MPQIIDAQSHPALFAAFQALFAAFQAVDVDNGAGIIPGVELLSDYEIPDNKTQWLVAAERGLSTLTPEELDTFCCGEHEEQDAIAGRNSDLSVASHLLTDFFNDWIE